MIIVAIICTVYVESLGHFWNQFLSLFQFRLRLWEVLC